MKWVWRSYILLGIWIIIAPWILGYARFTPALWGGIMEGIAVIMLALWGMFGNKNITL